MDETIAMLERRGVITLDPKKAEKCCGIPRDDDGFCQHRPGHPIYVEGGEVISVNQYTDVIGFRYSVAHFECAVGGGDCDHVYHPSGNQLPSVEDVMNHLGEEHAYEPTT